MRNALIGLLVMLSLLAPVPARGQADSREQLALSYLRLELALADAPDTLASRHGLDAGRVALLGHSMGAAIVAATASQQPGRTRAVACIAGSCAAAAGAGAAVPVAVIAGAIDPLFNASVLEQQADVLRAGTHQVDFRLMAGEGHTLVVGEALPDAMRWLSERLR